MKKYILAGLFILFSGCTTKSIDHTCTIDGANAPKWVCNGGSDLKNGIYAVGSAPYVGDMSAQRTEAMAVARDELSREISLKVQNMVKTYVSDIGVGKDKKLQRVVDIVSRQITNNILRGSKIIQTWISPKKEMFVLVGISADDLKRSVDSLTKEELLKLKAKEAQEELKEAIKELN